VRVEEDGHAASALQLAAANAAAWPDDVGIGPVALEITDDLAIPGPRAPGVKRSLKFGQFFLDLHQTGFQLSSRWRHDCLLSTYWRRMQGTSHIEPGTPRH